MFQIRYRLVEDGLDELRNLDSPTFESEWGDIHGQIRLTFSAHEFGYVSDKVPFGHQPLLLWFDILLDALISLREGNYVLMSQLGNHGAWIQFERQGDNVGISEIRFEPKEGHAPFILGIRPLSEETEVEWCGVTVLMSSMVNEITYQCSNLIEEMRRLNPKICNSRKVRNLMGKLQRFE